MAYMDQQGFAAAAAASPARQSKSGGFSALEWSVIALARRDSLASLEAPGPIARAFGSLFGLGAQGRLADSRLEALRRLAVHAWARGFALPLSEIARFKLAGFSADQAETLIASVGAERTAGRCRRRAA